MSTVTAGQVAAELRRLADALDKEPETEIEPMLLCSYHFSESDKPHFLNLVGLLPRPIGKKWGPDVLDVTVGVKWESPVCLQAQIRRSAVCRIVKPAQAAEYECDPILFASEEAQLDEAQEVSRG
jgi:predicted RNA-binding Zn-ribbon protein involved in translation (DUF1610 family)